jgi:hypothetical protein
LKSIEYFSWKIPKLKFLFRKKTMPLIKTSRNEQNLPVLEEEEIIHSSQTKVALFFELHKSEGFGTLFVTTKRVLWFSDSPNDSAQQSSGYGIGFREIMCHAIARAGSFADFQYSCIYCQLDSAEDEVHEMRFVPEDSSTLEKIYTAFSECALLNPDPHSEDEGDFFFNEDEITAAQSATLAVSRVLYLH